MMKRLSYYIMLLGIVFFTSCEDFLDQVPKHNLTLDNAVTDYSGAKNILNGMYSIVASNSAFGGATWCRLSSQGGFYSSYTANFNMAYKEGSNDMDGTWQALYSLVNSANAAIEAISNLAENKFPTPERKLKCWQRPGVCGAGLTRICSGCSGDGGMRMIRLTESCIGIRWQI